MVIESLHPEPISLFTFQFVIDQLDFSPFANFLVFLVCMVSCLQYSGKEAGKKVMDSGKSGDTVHLYRQWGSIDKTMNLF